MDYYSLGSLVFIAVMFYLLMVAPYRKRRKQLKDMLSELKVGDEIVTIGGIIGTVTSIEEEAIIVASGGKESSIKIQPEAVAFRMIKEEKTD